MKKIVFATHNKHKLEEVKQLLPHFEVLGLDDINCTEEIPETANTLQGNASQKSYYVFQNYQLDCFADDTGLEVEALNGAPGVFSARYAGEQKSSKDNMAKLLQELKGKDNRKARFRTVISLIEDGKEALFEGEVQGTIAEKQHGDAGFGYDPLFLPDEKQGSFAELSMEEKNEISHRGRAIRKLIAYLNTKSE